MQRKHMILFGVAGALAGATLTGVVATTSTSEYNVEAITQYSLTLDSNNFNFDDKLTDGFGSNSKSFTNERGNSIQIDYDNACKNSGGLLNLNAAGSIYNPYIEASEYLNKISGIKNIKVDFDNSVHANLTYEVGWEDQVVANIYHTRGTLTDNTIANCFNASYFRITNENAEPIKINSIVVTYSCAATKNPDYYTPGLKFSLDTVNNTYDVTGYDGTSKEIYIPKFYNGVRVTDITGCINFTEEEYNVYIPASINSIYKHAFKECPNTVIYCAQQDDLPNYDVEWTDGNVCVVYGYRGQKTTIDNITYALCIDERGKEIVSVAKVDKTATEARILKEVTFINDTITVSRLGTDAIFNCPKLKGIYVPTSITRAEMFAIENCPKATIYCEHPSKPDGFEYNWIRENNSTIWGFQNKEVAKDGITYAILKNGDGTEYARVSNIASESKTIKLEDKVTFDGKTYDVELMGKNCLVNNSNVEVLDLTGVERVLQSAVVNCPNLKEVKLSPKATYIGQWAFTNCPALTTLFVPGTISSLDNQILKDCPNTIAFTDATTKPQYWNITAFLNNTIIWGYKNIKIDTQDALYYVGTYEDQTVSYLAKYKDTKANFVMPDTVSDGINSYKVGVVAQRSIQNCQTLTDLTLSNNVISVEYYAVNKNINLKTITLDSKLKYIGAFAFKEHKNLNTVNGLASNIEKIGMDAFGMCMNLRPMVEPQTRPYGWDSSAFTGTVVYGYQGIKAEDASFKYALVKHNGQTGMLCYDTVTLTNEMKMPKTITVDGISYEINFLTNVLANKEGVKHFKIGRNVHTLYSYAFSSWDSVNIYIPSSVTHLDGELINGYYYGNIYIEHSSIPSGWPSGWEGYTNRSYIHWGASMGY